MFISESRKSSSFLQEVHNVREKTYILPLISVRSWMQGDKITVGDLPLVGIQCQTEVNKGFNFQNTHRLFITQYKQISISVCTNTKTSTYQYTYQSIQVQRLFIHIFVVTQEYRVKLPIDRKLLYFESTLTFQILQNTLI